MKAIEFFRGMIRAWVVVIAIAAGLIMGFAIRGALSPEDGSMQQAGQHAQQSAADEATQIWTCSMHPQIKLPKPGLCPICNMELILLETQAEDSGSGRELTVSENAKKLMDIETVLVQRKFVDRQIRMVGKIDYDETRVKYITAWVPGRLDRLFADYTGISVNKGDHMVQMYSPELLAAQEELLQSLTVVKELADSDIGIMRDTAEATVTAVREKLRLLGLQGEQIVEIERRGSVSDHVTIYSPIGGIVIHKNAQEGMYVKTGTKIYTIADLSRVWIRLDAYESDLMWLRLGQKVQFTTEAYPGQQFAGTISFIDPILTQTTRTVKVRVNVANPEMLLKPGMFVRATAKAMVASGGKVMDVALAGKWICPMHPDVIQDSAGVCDICEMLLVQTESLGYLGVDTDLSEAPLVIPATAAMVTGDRAIVYVQLPGKDKPTFEGREIVLGPRAGDYYLVKHGLAEGERVVIKGNFKIDAELQIQAKPSMMSPGAGNSHDSSPVAGPEISSAFQEQLTRVVRSYLQVQNALSADDFDGAVSAAAVLAEAVDAVDMQLVPGDEHMAWMMASGKLKNSLANIIAPDDIEAIRKTFASLSDEIVALVKRFGVSGISLYQFKCPMALDGSGAFWLQKDSDTRNPYYGESMLQCGEVIEVLQGVTEQGDSHE